MRDPRTFISESVAQFWGRHDDPNKMSSVFEGNRHNHFEDIQVETSSIQAASHS